MTMTATIERYYLKADHEVEWSNVTREQFIAAEQSAGFRSKFGNKHVATGGFTGRGMRGRVESVPVMDAPANRTGYPVFDGILDSIAPQPAPDTGGEWRVEAMPTHGWRVVDATGQEVVADVYREKDAVQIVAEHNAVGLLVAALKEAKAQITNSSELAKAIAEPHTLAQIDAALAAVRQEEQK